MKSAIDSSLLQVLAASGYSDEVLTAAGSVCALLPFAFTWGLVVGLTLEGYERRYCFETESDARDALCAWDGLGHPSGPWIKVKGAGIDQLNPSFGCIEAVAR